MWTVISRIAAPALARPRTPTGGAGPTPIDEPPRVRTFVPQPTPGLERTARSTRCGPGRTTGSCRDTDSGSRPADVKPDESAGWRIFALRQLSRRFPPVL